MKSYYGLGKGVSNRKINKMKDRVNADEADAEMVECRLAKWSRLEIERMSVSEKRQNEMLNEIRCDK